METTAVIKYGTPIAFEFADAAQAEEYKEARKQFIKYAAAGMHCLTDKSSDEVADELFELYKKLGFAES